jgi:cytoskeletal protein CcmA (bactofilin family)
MGSILPSNTFGGRGQELFVPVGGIEPEIDVIVQGTLTVLGDEVSLPTADLVMGLGDITAHSATLAAQVSCANINVTDLVQCARATITGELIAGSLNIDGPLEITNLTASSADILGDITAADIIVSRQVRSTTVQATGYVQCGSVATSGDITAGGTTANFGNATLTGNVIHANSDLSVGSHASIVGNLTVGGQLTVTGGIDPPPIVPGFQCSSIKFGQLLIAFGFGTTGFDGSVTYTTPPFISVFSISATGNSGVNCLYARNTENGPAGSIRLVATNTAGVPTGTGVGINLVAFLRVA